MELSTKKLIAREGLIILGILITSTLLYFLSIMYETRNEELKDYGKIYNLVDPETNLKFELPATSKEALANRIQALEQETTKDIIKYVESVYKTEIDVINQRETNKNIAEKLLYLFLFVLFAVYPIYLILRFVAWSFRTLAK